MVFIVACGNEKIGEYETKEECIIFLKKSFGDRMIKPDNYHSSCQGMLEEWRNSDIPGFPVVRILELEAKKSSITDLLKVADKNKVEEVRVPKPVKKVRITACTPTRTRLVTNKKTPPIPASEVEEGTIKEGNDSALYISKKLKDGSSRWTRYYEETHDGLERKRKAPKGKAKEYKEGTVMKGEDGKKWRVKQVKKGVFKWVRVM